MVTCIAGTAGSLLDGLVFEKLLFEVASTVTTIVLDLDSPRHLRVRDCVFLADATSTNPYGNGANTGPAPINCQAIYLRTTHAYGGNDNSWSRIENNAIYQMALGTWGNDSGTMQDNNQHVISGNFGIGLHHYLTYDPAVSTTCRPFIKVRGGNRCVVRDNNFEAYGTGLYMDGCWSCMESGDGGEATDVFVDMYNCKGCNIEPLGISESAIVAGGRATSADGVTTSASPNISSASGAFAANDKGRGISGVGIPAGTRVLSVTDSTHVVLDKNASASGTGITFTLLAQFRNAVLVRGDSFTKAYIIKSSVSWVYWDPGARTDFIMEATDAGIGAAAWSSGVTYSAGNTVSNGGFSFVCLLGNAATNTTPPEVDLAHWAQLHPSVQMASNDGVIIAPRTTEALGVPWAGGPANIAASALIVATKGSDQTYTSSSTTLQNDNDLILVMSGNGTDEWFVEYFLFINTANATMDFKAALSLGATGATGDLYYFSTGSASIPDFGGSAGVVGTTPSNPASLSATLVWGSAGGLWAASFGARILDGGTGGSVTLQCAQNTSDAGAITLKKGSFLRATKLI
jgi:hypothetical protein